MAFSTLWGPQQKGLILDGCAGPGGWSWGILNYLRLRDLGIEWDDAAVATRKAARLATRKADVSTFDLRPFLGRVWGLLFSPPCTLFSEAGTRIGRLVLDVLAEGIRRVMRGEDCREEIRERVFPVALAAQEKRDAGKPAEKRRSREQLEAAAREDAFIACLVLEPARYLHALLSVEDPEVPFEWAALEQVPAALPLWEVYAQELRRLGWSVWTGVLCTADYGVPQERYRAVLLASAVRAVSAPEPTHSQHGGGEDLFGGFRAPWPTMAGCIGWGFTDRPAPTVTAGGAKSGGVEPFARGAREALKAALVSGKHWAWKPGVPRTYSPSAISIDAVESGLLQTFPRNFPWHGPKGKAQEQSGNAVPPLFAAHVVSAASGVPFLQQALTRAA